MKMSLMNLIDEYANTPIYRKVEARKVVFKAMLELEAERDALRIFNDESTLRIQTLTEAMEIIERLKAERTVLHSANDRFTAERGMLKAMCVELKNQLSFEKHARTCEHKRTKSIEPCLRGYPFVCLDCGAEFTHAGNQPKTCEHCKYFADGYFAGPVPGKGGICTNKKAVKMSTDELHPTPDFGCNQWEQEKS